MNGSVSAARASTPGRSPPGRARSSGAASYPTATPGSESIPYCRDYGAPVILSAMEVHLTRPMIEALKAAPDIPEHLLKPVAAAKAQDDGYLVDFDEDEAMAITEMCQWYIRKDPVTGKLGPKAEIFDAIVRSIYKAE